MWEQNKKDGGISGYHWTGIFLNYYTEKQNDGCTGQYNLKYLPVL